MKKLLSLFIVLLLVIVGLYFFKPRKNDNTPNVPNINNTKQTEITNTLHTQDNEKEAPLKPFAAVNETDISVSNQNINIPETLDQAQLQKEVFQDLESRMTTQMKEIPGCLEIASTKKEVLACTKELRELNREFALLLGIDNERDPQDPQFEKDFVWNETTKENMIKELDSGIILMQEMFNCIEDSTTPEEQKQCFGVNIEIE